MESKRRRNAAQHRHNSRKRKNNSRCDCVDPALFTQPQTPKWSWRGCKVQVLRGEPQLTSGPRRPCWRTAPPGGTRQTHSRWNIWPTTFTSSLYRITIKYQHLTGRSKTISSLWGGTGTTEWWTLDSPAQRRRINRKCRTLQVVVVTAESKQIVIVVYLW